MKVDFAKRTVTGKGVSALRKEGVTPVICYGAQEDSTPYSVQTKDLINLLSSEEVIFDAAGEVSGKKVLLQDISYHPLTGTPLHADFLFVDATQEVEYEVPIQIEGESPVVKANEGQMNIALDKIKISALPQDIPSYLVADINSLKAIGDHLSVENIPLPKGVTLVTNPDEVVISIVEQAEFEEEEETNEADLESIEVTSTRGKKEDETDTTTTTADEQ